MALTLKINGTPHEVDVDGDTPAFVVLRDLLGMTGTKFGCGPALCGAFPHGVAPAFWYSSRTEITPVPGRRGRSSG